MKREIRTLSDKAGKLMEAGDFKAAKCILLDLSERDPASPAILAVLGHACCELGELEDAARIFQRAIEVRPKLEAVSLGRFHCLWQLGRYEEALEEVERFQTISDSEDYREIVKEINEKSREV